MLCDTLDVLKFDTVQHGTAQHSIVQYNTAQHTTVQYSTDLLHSCDFLSFDIEKRTAYISYKTRYYLLIISLISQF